MSKQASSFKLVRYKNVLNLSKVLLLEISNLFANITSQLSAFFTAMTLIGEIRAANQQSQLSEI